MWVPEMLEGWVAGQLEWQPQPDSSGAANCLQGDRFQLVATTNCDGKLGLSLSLAKLM